MSEYEDRLRRVQLTLSHIPEPERTRRQIIDRLLAAEFGGRTVTDRPAVPPEQWAEVLGEDIDQAIFAKAAQAWREEVR